jgi:hypothetical protein
MKRDPITVSRELKTYIRIVEDLERIAATIPPERMDPRLWNEIKEVKEELSKHGYTYLDGFSRPFRLVPEK